MNRNDKNERRLHFPIVQGGIKNRDSSSILITDQFGSGMLF